MWLCKGTYGQLIPEGMKSRNQGPFDVLGKCDFQIPWIRDWLEKNKRGFFAKYVWNQRNAFLVSVSKHLFLCQSLSGIGDQSRRTGLILCHQIVVKIRKRKFHFLSKSDFLVTHLSPDCGIFSRVRCKTGHRFLRDVAPKI